MVINADGTEEHLAATLPDYPNLDGWSHDAAYLAITNHPVASYAVYLVRPDGSDLRAIDKAVRPAWRP